MKENFTELVFILDRSGSMHGLESDTINGFNALIEKQKKLKGDARLTTVLFDTEYLLLHDGVNLKDVTPLTENDYRVGGLIALLDAIGKTVDSVGKRLSETPEVERPDRVLFVITTDGYENASKTYEISRIKEMIEHQRSKYSWEFLFLGANIDAIGAAEDLGISAKNAVRYRSDSKGVSLCYDRSLDTAVTSYRASRYIPNEWMEESKNDYEQRKDASNAQGGDINDKT